MAGRKLRISHAVFTVNYQQHASKSISVIFSEFSPPLNAREVFISVALFVCQQHDGNGRTDVRHYSDVIMSAMSSQTTGVSIVCSTICLGADQRIHPSSVSLAFVRGIHRWPMNSPHKRPVTRKCFNLMTSSCEISGLFLSRLDCFTPLKLGAVQVCALRMLLVHLWYQHFWKIFTHTNRKIVLILSSDPTYSETSFPGIDLHQFENALIYSFGICIKLELIVVLGTDIFTWMWSGDHFYKRLGALKSKSTWNFTSPQI